MKYDDKSIQVFKGVEAVRKRPMMYITSLDASGIRHMFREILTNAVDEHLAGYGNKLIVKKVGSQIIVRDFGRGVPFGIHPEEQINTLTLVATQLHAGGKFDENLYKISAGLHGVGLSVVNALSSSLIIKSFRDGKSAHQFFKKGIPDSDVVLGSTSEENGTLVVYTPDNEIFNTIDISVDWLVEDLFFISCLNSLHIVADLDGQDLELKDRSPCSLIESKDLLHEVIEIPNATADNKVYVLFAFSLSYNPKVFCFVNNVPVQRGNFLSSFYDCFAKQLNESGMGFESGDLQESISLVLSIRAPVSVIHFKGQSKEVADLKYDKIRPLYEYLFDRVWEARGFKALLTKYYKPFLTAVQQRRAKSKDLKNALKELGDQKTTTIILPGKLADCQDQEGYGELYIVEGESVSYDTMIPFIDKKGVERFLRICDINPEDIESVRSFNLHSGKYEIKRVIGVIRHLYNKKYIFRVKVKGGFWFDITEDNQSIYVYRDSSLHEVGLSDIKIGDLLVSPIQEEFNIISSPINVISVLVRVVGESRTQKISNKFIQLDYQDFDFGVEGLICSLKDVFYCYGMDRSTISRWTNISYNALEGFDRKRYSISLFHFGKVKKFIQDFNEKDFFIKLPLTEENVKYYSGKSSFQFVIQRGSGGLGDHFLSPLPLQYKMSVDLAFIIGQYIGDGYHRMPCTPKAQVAFCIGEDKHLISDQLRLCSERLFKSHGTITESKPANKCFQLGVLELRLILYALGLTHEIKSSDKFIPQCFFSESKEVVESLLKGLYLSGGYLTTDTDYFKLGFETSSRRLAFELCRLLFLYFGIIPVFQSKPSKRYIIQGISGITKEVFCVTINKYNDQIRLKFICKLFESFNSDKNISDRPQYFCQGDFRYIPVVKIERVPYNNPYVYDLSIKDNENFHVGAIPLLVHNSASGTAKQARDRRFQAILPIRGKTLNTLKATLSKTVESDVIKDIFAAVGVDISGKQITIRPRYSKIIIASDADSVSAETKIPFINKDGFIRFDRIDSVVLDKIHSVLSLNVNSRESENKKVLRIISHKYNKKKMYRITTKGYSEDVTKDHMVYTFNCLTDEICRKGPLEINTKRDFLIISNSLPVVNREITLDLRESLIEVQKSENSLFIRVLAKDFDWKVDGTVKLTKGNIQFTRELSRYKVERLLGFSKNMLQTYDEGKGRIPLDVFQRIREIVPVDLSTVYVYVKYSKENFHYLDILGSCIIDCKRNIIDWNVTLDSEIAYLVGLYIGDGSWGTGPAYAIEFATGLNLYEDFIRNCSKKLGYHFKEYFRIENCAKAVICSIQFQAILYELGLRKSVNHSVKFIPEIFFSATESTRKALLLGLYHSDGSFYYALGYSPCLDFRTTSESLRDGLTFLLRQFGVFPSLRTRPPNKKLKEQWGRSTIIDRKPIFVVTCNQQRDIVSLDFICRMFNLENLSKYKTPVVDFMARTRDFIPLTETVSAVRIRRIEEVSYAYDRVYDLEVEEHHNFGIGMTGMILRNSDGKHITCLLLTFFLQWMRPLIEQGYIYIARSPLYRIVEKTKIQFAYSDIELSKIQKSPGAIITRFKGLGELNPNELAKAIFDPLTRHLSCVSLNDLTQAATVTYCLMGPDREMRWDFINEFMSQIDYEWKGEV
jgi:DNA gyrase/topoisomerase IV subunit B